MAIRITAALGPWFFAGLLDPNLLKALGTRRFLEFANKTTGQILDLVRGDKCFFSNGWFCQAANLGLAQPLNNLYLQAQACWSHAVNSTNTPRNMTKNRRVLLDSRNTSRVKSFRNRRWYRSPRLVQLVRCVVVGRAIS